MKGFDPQTLQSVVLPGTRCLCCDYALEGLSIDPSSPCPECGTPIEHSLSNRPITLADLHPNLQRQIATRLALAAAVCTLAFAATAPLYLLPSPGIAAIIKVTVFLVTFSASVVSVTSVLTRFPQLRIRADQIRYGFMIVPAAGTIYVASLLATLFQGSFQRAGWDMHTLLLVLSMTSGPLVFIISFFALWQLMSSLGPLSVLFGMPRLHRLLTPFPMIVWLIISILLPPLGYLSVSMVLWLLARRANNAARGATLVPRAA